MNAIALFWDILRINFLLLLAVVCGTSAWFIWPDSLEWWGFGVISIILGTATFRLLYMAFGLMYRVELFARYKKSRANPKSARLVSEADLHKAGMK
jgi:membrane protein YdbS with pleckstrin-like domain